MFTRSFKVVLIYSILLAFANTVLAQAIEEEEYVDMRSRQLNGPRLGVTGVILGSEKFKKTLQDRGVGNGKDFVLISQFGWHFEWLIVPESGGPSFTIELIPFIGGVEYGTVIPSTSLVMGIRLPKGFEFGMGPSVVVTAARNDPVFTSLVFGLGKSINYRGVSIPLNLAYAHNPKGNRVSFVFGYALPSKKKTHMAKNETATNALLAFNSFEK